MIHLAGKASFFIKKIVLRLLTEDIQTNERAGHVWS